jgi:hypothetical protein
LSGGGLWPPATATGCKMPLNWRYGKKERVVGSIGIAMYYSFIDKTKINVSEKKLTYVSEKKLIYLQI